MASRNITDEELYSIDQLAAFHGVDYKAMYARIARAGIKAEKVVNGVLLFSAHEITTSRIIVERNVEVEVIYEIYESKMNYLNI